MIAKLVRAASAAALLSTCALATVTATPLGSSGYASVTPDGMGGYTVTCTSTSPNSKLTHFFIEGDGNDVISSIHITNSSASTRCDVTIRKAPSALAGIASVGQITWSTTTGQPVFIQNLEVEGDVGDIEVSSIYSALVDNDLTGDVRATNSAIRELLVGRDIGSPGSPSTIEAIGQIDRISVAYNAFANIDSAPTGSGSDWLGAIDIGGNFVGTIQSPAARVNSGIPSGGGSFIGVRIDGETHGTIAFDRFGRQEGLISSSQSADMELGDPYGLDDGELSADGKVLITKEFGPYGNIAVATGGLKGQITINAGNATANAWQGAITVGTLGLPEGYSILPSAIGDGAAGVAPFTMHEATASPPNNYFVFITALDISDPGMNCYDAPFDDEITFRLYGPVSLEGGMGPHAEVQFWNGSAWVDAGFDVVTTIVGGTGSRGLKFERSGGAAWPQTVGQYRIVPAAGRIVCTDVVGEPTADFAYYIELHDGCVAGLLSTFDLDGDEDLASGDIAEWTTTPVDFNEDSYMDTDDLNMLMNAITLFNSR